MESVDVGLDEMKKKPNPLVEIGAFRMSPVDRLAARGISAGKGTAEPPHKTKHAKTPFTLKSRRDGQKPRRVKAATTPVPPPKKLKAVKRKKMPAPGIFFNCSEQLGALKQLIEQRQKAKKKRRQSNKPAGR